MHHLNNFEVTINSTNLPLEYKLLEWRLIINRELYEAKIIDLKTFSAMENSLLTRMTKIKNNLFQTTSR